MARALLSAVLFFVMATVAVAQDTYKIQPGDVLRIEVLEDNTLNRNSLVLPDGTFAFPLVGTIRAAGKTISSVRTTLTNALAPSFASPPTVFVSIASLAGGAAAFTGQTQAKQINVFVMGEVARPGKIAIDEGTSLLQFLAEAGGFTNFAATKRIQLRRTDPKSGRDLVYKFNYKAVERGSASASSLVLREGDVIVVPQRTLFE